MSYERYNAFIDGGWPARLKPREVNLWHAYNRHADDQGIAWPSVEELGRKIGDSCLSRIREARAALVKAGLIVVEKQGGGRNKPSVIRVLVPGQAKEPVNRDGNCPPLSKKQGQKNRDGFGAQTGTDLERKQGRIRSAHKEEHPKEHPKEQNTIPAAAAQPQEKRAPKGSRKLSPEQLEAWKDFTDWWTFTAWPKRHGGEVYDFQSVDGAKSLAMLRDPRFKFATDPWGANALIKACAQVFMDEPENHGNWDHRLTRMHQMRGWLLRLATRRKSEGDHRVITAKRKPTAAERGEYAEDISLPDFAPPVSSPIKCAAG